MPTNIAPPSPTTSFVFNPNQVALAAVPSIPSGTSSLSGPIVTSSLDPGTSPFTSSSTFITNPPATADSSSTAEAADLTPDQDSEIRFQWEEVEPALLPVDKADYNNQQFELAQTDEFNEIESRVFALDTWRAGSDTANDIASFRVIAYEFGQINTKKQIFPRQGTGQGQYGLLYKKMIITSMNPVYMERSQIIKSNSALHAYFFNDAPEVLSIQGFLKTSSQDPWDIAMVLLWDRLLRATELARHNAILEFAIADVIYWGYPLSFVPQISANTQFVASFSMQLLIIDKLLPLQNLDQSVLELTDSIEQSSGFVTTSKMATNDIDIQTPLPDLALDGLPSDKLAFDPNPTDPNNIALGRGPMTDLGIALAGPGVPTNTSAIPASVTDMFIPSFTQPIYVAPTFTVPPVLA